MKGTEEVRAISKENSIGYNDLLGTWVWRYSRHVEFETEIWSCKMTMPLEEFEKSGRGTNFTAKMINLVYKC